MKRNDRSPPSKSIRGWLISAFLGAIIAWASSGVILPLVFGTIRKSSSSVWMLSGVNDLVIGIMCIPAFFLAHGISYGMLKDTDTSQWRVIRSIAQGIFFYWIILILAWGENGPVLRAL